MPWFQYFPYHVLLILRGSILVLDDLWGLTINVSTIVVLVFNRNPWVLKLPNIHTGCTGELIQELSQLLQIIVKIVAFLEVAVELLDLLLLLILQILLALSLFLLLLNKLTVLPLQLKYAALSVDLLFKL